MGLDVYLNRCPNRAKARKAEALCEAAVEAAWESVTGSKSYNDLTEEEKETARKAADAVRVLHGMDEYCQHPDVQEVRNNSAKYPEHIFKVGYFRSSYNDAGINSMLSRLSLPDLYEIMDACEGQYEQTHDWTACRERAITTLARLRALNQRHDVFVMKTTNPAAFNNAIPPRNEREVLALFSKISAEHTNKPNAWRSFSSRDGEFILDGLKVVALIPGTRELFGREPVIYVVHERESMTEWYEQALEIVIETCDYVLAQPDPENYYMKWSG